MKTKTEEILEELGRIKTFNIEKAIQLTAKKIFEDICSFLIYQSGKAYYKITEKDFQELKKKWQVK